VTVHRERWVTTTEGAYTMGTLSGRTCLLHHPESVAAAVHGVEVEAGVGAEILAKLTPTTSPAEIG